MTETLYVSLQALLKTSHGLSEIASAKISASGTTVVSLLPLT